MTWCLVDVKGGSIINSTLSLAIRPAYVAFGCTWELQPPGNLSQFASSHIGQNIRSRSTSPGRPNSVSTPPITVQCHSLVGHQVLTSHNNRR